MPDIIAELWCDDVEQTLQFYRDVMGFTLLHASVVDGRLTRAQINFEGSSPLILTYAGPKPGAVKKILDGLCRGVPRGLGVVILVEIGEQRIREYYDVVREEGCHRN
jgi:catechol 2,3-dioxygenase-like lactoylglutathione lyase family enzyme